MSPCEICEPIWHSGFSGPVLQAFVGIPLVKLNPLLSCRDPGHERTIEHQIRLKRVGDSNWWNCTGKPPSRDIVQHVDVVDGELELVEEVQIIGLHLKSYYSTDHFHFYHFQGWAIKPMAASRGDPVYCRVTSFKRWCFKRFKNRFALDIQ